MLDLNVQYMLELFEKSYPDTLDRAFKLFKAFDFKDFNIRTAHECIFGITNGYSAESIYAAEKLRLYTLWNYSKVSFSLDEQSIKSVPFNTQIERKKFAHQPFRTYYVQLNDLKPLTGFFISVGYHWDDDSLNNLMTDYSEAFLSLVIAGEKPENFRHVSFNIDLTKTTD